MRLALYANKTHQRKRFREGRKEFYQDLLARDLGLTVYTPKDRIPIGTHLISWGCSHPPRSDVAGYHWLGNTLTGVANMSHKIKMLKRFRNRAVPSLSWCRDKDSAQMWLDEGEVVYARKLLQSHSGKGLVRVKPGEVLPDAPLYTKGITGKFREYRVHFFNGKIIAVQIKRRMSAESMAERGIVPPDEETRSAVRVYRNGWVFCVNNVNLSDRSREVCKEAMLACQAGTGCVDILVKGNEDTFVIETNSAPALRSPTVRAAYARAIREASNEQGN